MRTKLIVTISLLCAMSCTPKPEIKYVYPQLTVEEQPVTKCGAYVNYMVHLPLEDRTNDDQYLRSLAVLLECYDKRVDDLKDNIKRYRTAVWELNKQEERANEVQ